jgi:plastocyanin
MNRKSPHCVRPALAIGLLSAGGGNVVATNHTVTLGQEPPDLILPSPNVFVDADGARHAIIGSPSDNVHSGFISSAPQDRIGLPQPVPGPTRFRVTLTTPGVYDYICSLHDDLGMRGQVVVVW